MIKIDAKNNNLEFEGNKPELGALIRQFVKRGVLNEKDFDMLKETAFLSDEEIYERSLKSLEHLTDMIDKAILGSDREDLKEKLRKAMEKEWEK